MPGRLGPGRGHPVARVARNQMIYEAATQQQREREAARETKPAPKKEKEPVKQKEISYDCEFPRCGKPSEYGFNDKGSYPQFCLEHKSAEMVLLVSDPNNPKGSSLDRVRQYKKMYPTLKELKEAPAKAAACKAEIKKLSSEIHKEDHDIKQLTKGIEELDAGLASQEKKPKLTGKTLLGKGVFGQDEGLIEKLKKEKESKEEKVVDRKGDREINVSRLHQLKIDLQVLEKDAVEYASIEKTMKELKATAIQNEASGLYLQLKAKGMGKEMHAEGEIIFARLLKQAEMEA